MATVDIVVPCYKYGHFLRDCLPSISAQEGVDLRVLVIDDASPDDSFAIATELAAQDPRIEVACHRDNRGLMATLNEGIDWAKAEYFHVLSADDLLAPGSLARAAAIMQRHPNVGLVHGAELDLRAGDRIPAVPDETAQAAAGMQYMTGRQFVEATCRVPINHVGSSTAFVRTTVQRAAGYYNPELPHTSDFEMWLRIAAISDVVKTQAVQGIRRYHGANMSDFFFSVLTRDFTERLAAFDSFFATVGKALPHAEQLHGMARRRLAEEAYWGGLSRLLRGQLGSGQDLVGFAFKHAPSLKLLPPFGHLLRRKDTVRRSIEVLGEAVWGKRHVPVP